MEPISGIADLVLVLLFSAISGILSVRFRIPPVAGLLIVGMLIGPNMLDLVNPGAIGTYSDIGAVLLLFMIGLEFSVTKLLSSGLRAVISSMVLMVMLFILMHEVAVLLGFDFITSLFIAATFSMSSTAIMMKILEQKKLIERPEVPVLVTILIIEDVVAIFMLTFFSNLRNGLHAGDGYLSSIIIAIGILVFTYIILLKFLKDFSTVFFRYQADDTLILFASILCIGMSALASLLGFTPAIGAFLAGSLISALPNGREFERSIRPFSVVFSSFFFLSVGMLVMPGAILVSALPSALIILSFIILVFLATSVTFFLTTASGRSSIFAGLAMIPLGEFSLLIAKEGAGLTGIDLVGLVSAGVLVTSLVSSLSLDSAERLYVGIRKMLPIRFIQRFTDASGYFRNVVSAFEPKGYFHKVLLHEVNRITVDVLYLAGATMFFWMGRNYLGFQMDILGNAMPADLALLAVLSALSLIPIARILLSVKRLFDALSSIFSRTTPQTSKGAILRNIVISSLFFVVFATFNLIVNFMLLPPQFNWLALIFAAFSIFFFWSAIRAASLGFFLNETHGISLLRSEIMVSRDDAVVVGKRNDRSRGDDGDSGAKRNGRHRHAGNGGQ